VGVYVTVRGGKFAITQNKCGREYRAGNAMISGNGLKDFVPKWE
jgi:hypothetical protein